jgi:hypothetical protein
MLPSHTRRIAGNGKTLSRQRLPALPANARDFRAHSSRHRRGDHGPNDNPYRPAQLPAGPLGNLAQLSLLVGPWLVGRGNERDEAATNLFKANASKTDARSLSIQVLGDSWTTHRGKRRLLLSCICAKGVSRGSLGDDATGSAAMSSIEIDFDKIVRLANWQLQLDERPDRRAGELDKLDANQVLWS